MKKIIQRIYKFISTDIWEFKLSEATKRMYALIATIRVASITATAFNRNKVLSQAASLAYASLLALGPLIALVILTSSVFLKSKGETYIYDQVLHVMEFTMPALNIENSAGAQDNLSPQIAEFIDTISKKSASLGVFGVTTVIATCILLCATMENAFNHLWNVRRNRKWVSRLVYYWAFISIGSVLGLLGMAFFASSHLSSVFSEIPYFEYFQGGSSLFFGFLSLSFLLAFVYKFMPNANVRFVPALSGALLAAAALMLNNKLSFIYMGTVLSKQDLYGYLAIIPLAIFCLYIFWVIVLMGAQISFSVQNLDMLSSKYLWDKLSHRSRNLLCLAIFSKITRAFLNGQKSPSLKKMSLRLKLSMPLIQSCINELLEKDLIAKIVDDDVDYSVYRPTVSPENLKLAEFFERLNSNMKEDRLLAIELSSIEVSIKRAVEAFNEFQKTKYSTLTIKEVL